MSTTAPQLLFTNARIFDGTNADCTEGMFVRVADGLIQEVSAQPIGAPGAQVIDAGGRTLMPGLIDAHVHAFASDVVVQKVEALGEAYRTAHAVRMLRHALSCGFTTVRDIGGGNYSLYRALADGLIEGPRFLYSGKILSMTGGHGDIRQIEERPRYQAICGCGDAPLFNAFAVLADGVDACIRAAREELRQGAHCIKIMGSGGVASPTDPIWMNQYREFTLRREVFTPVELLRQATSVPAEMMMMEGQIGCIAPGAFADLLVVDGDPLQDVGLLAANGQRLSTIVRAGVIVKNELN